MVIIKPPGAGGEAGTEATYTCSASLSVGQIVYVSGSNTVDLADNTNINTVPCIGMIISKPTSTSCTIKNTGEVTNLTGIIPGQKYYVGSGGAITDTPPTTTNTITQIVCVGVKNDTILLTLSYNFVENK